MQEPEVWAPSPKSKKKLRGSPSGSVLLQRSKVTVSGPGPDGGSGFVVRTANGALFALGSVVVVVVTGARVVVVVVVLMPTATVVVVVALLLLLATTTAVPATAAPAPTMPTTAAVPIVPAPTNPAGTLGNTATVALFRNGATGTSFLHSCADRTTIGADSAVRAGSKALFW